MSGRGEYGEADAAQCLEQQTEAMPNDMLGAVQTSVELGIRSILFYAVEMIGLKGEGEVAVGKVENDELEYEVVVRCKKKRKIILLGE